ncbi:MAG: NADH-quinone oxidoreductase subunit A [Planctomycetota bacterium]|nr:MAG: NADH-quinone oxidoreductase subunit A [Planctomycetota bacterium]
MTGQYIPILCAAVVSVGLAAGMLLLSRILGPRNLTKRKTSTYECGVEPTGSTRERFPIKFYIIAMLFILFDIEIIFMIPWAIEFRQLGFLGFIEMAVFIGVLVVGLVYVWKKGALEWD